jgi:putative transcriptional regulator
VERTLDTAAAVKHAFHALENKVKELREAAGLSQSELGAELEVSRQTINSIERGRYLPSLPLALALARFFETSVEELFEEEE